MTFNRPINTNTAGRPLPYLVAAVATMALIAGCSSTQKMSDAQLEYPGEHARISANPSPIWVIR